MGNEKYITIGKIVNTQGHRGEVRVYPLTDFPDRFKEMESVVVNSGERHRTLHIERVYFHKRFVIIKFKEIKDMNDAEMLKGGLLQIDRHELVPLPEGSFYIFEIIGLSVYTESGDYLGKVADVLQTGANDVYLVDRDEEGQVLIPALKKVVKKVDLEKGFMLVELPEGLL